MEIEFETTDNDAEPLSSGEPSVVRRRAAAGLGAVMLVAAAGGIGFGLGNAAGSPDESITPLAEPDADHAPETDTTDPDEAPDDDDSSDDTSNRSDDPDVGIPVTTMLLGDARGDLTNDVPASEATSIEMSSGTGWTTFDGQAMQLLAERTTDSGLVLRAHLGETWDGHGYHDDFDPSGWTPPAWCFESGQVRVALGGGAAAGSSIIDVGGVSWWNEPFRGRSASLVTLGRADGSPHRVVFVQTPSDTTSVTVTFADGSIDTTTPVDGVALLVVPGAPETIVHIEEDHGYTWTEERPDFDISFEGGADPATITDGQNSGYDDPEFRASCSPPPPALPSPGDQPADAAFAEETIIDLMSRIYGNNDDESFDTLDFIDDPTGVAAAREQVSEGSFEDAAASANAIVEEIVFTTPTEAWFRYRIETTTGTFGDRFGIAVDIDGEWKITRQTICQDLGLAGGSCGGEYIENIYPTDDG